MATLSNKREILQAILDKEDDLWIIMKPSRNDPADPEDLCIFQSPRRWKEARVEIPMGILHSFDRLRLQGSLRYLYCAEIFEEYLSQAKVLYKDFKQFATGLTNEVCQDAERLAQSLKRPFTYLNSSALSKEELARKIAERDGIKEGLVAIFRCVEPCRTYKMRGNYQTKKLKPQLQLGKCLHLYFYVQHRRLGLLHLRLQTWFPFLIHICLNGHEPSARYRG